MPKYDLLTCFFIYNRLIYYYLAFILIIILKRQIDRNIFENM